MEDRNRIETNEEKRNDTKNNKRKIKPNLSANARTYQVT